MNQNPNKLDILAIAAHPDDAELACSGTILKHIKQGYKVGILDLTEGELGTRGNRQLRYEEANKSSKILGVHFRHNLNLGDGFFEINTDSLMRIIEVLRFTQPEIVLANAPSDRHPDHGRASELTSRACFLSGLPKIISHWNDQEQSAHRPKNIYHYIQDRNLIPDIIIDITDEYSTKIESIKAFSSQFYSPKSKEPITPISTEDFFHFIEARAREFGRPIGATYAEGFKVEKGIGVNDLFSIN
jgi:bacillithiol biosynthesis deacetylase BshB1